MNINMLRDSDNNAGFYAAACAADPASLSWSGATLYVSADGGVTYSMLMPLTVAAIMGHATNVLGNFHTGNIVDEINHVNVALVRGSLSSTTLTGLLANVNACIIGDEILCFRDVTLETDGSFTLRGLLRGRRGSEYAMGTHAISDRFILADISTLSRVAQDTADIGIPKKYKAVTSGMSIADTSARDFTNLGTGLMPYAPAQLGGGFNSTGDAVLTWVRRNRISGEWRDSVDVPNSEASESYDIEIYDAGFSTLKRTLTSGSPTVAYTAAQQTTDFGSPQSSVHFRVYQMSAVVGRGHPADGAI